MSTPSCTIELENAVDIYRPGEVIKGEVILKINGTNTLSVKALSLQFTGFAYTKWEKRHKNKKPHKAKDTTFIENREDYVSTKNYLIGSEMANPKPLEPGTYTYSFIVHIPQNIPSTFDSPLGFIRYDLLVNADYGDQLVTLYSLPINIEKLKDLRLLDSTVHLPAEREQLEQKAFLKFWQQPLQLYVSVPQKAFVAGECISVHAKVTNMAKLKLNSITSLLNRITIYKGFMKDRTPHTNTEINTIVSNVHRLYGQNSSIIQHLQQILIPKISTSMPFDESRCISVSYELEVVVICENKKRSVRASVPIVMGSISLRSDVKILPSSEENNNVASITVARSMDELTVPSDIDLQESVVGMETMQLRASASSLATSFKEAAFMTAAQLNKKSRHNILGDSHDFKPMYLYYDHQEDQHTNLQDGIANTSQQETQHNTGLSEKTEML